MIAPSMQDWPAAFRAYAERKWGNTWKDRAVDQDAIRSTKLAFRAGFRSALRGQNASSAIVQEPALVTRLRAHVRELDSLSKVPWVSGTMGGWVGSVIADVCEAMDTLSEQGDPEARVRDLEARANASSDGGGLWQGGREL